MGIREQLAQVFRQLLDLLVIERLPMVHVPPVSLAPPVRLKVAGPPCPSVTEPAENKALLPLICTLPVLPDAAPTITLEDVTILVRRPVVPVRITVP